MPSQDMSEQFSEVSIRPNEDGIWIAEDTGTIDSENRA